MGYPTVYGISSLRFSDFFIGEKLNVNGTVVIKLSATEAYSAKENNVIGVCRNQQVKRVRGV